MSRLKYNKIFEKTFELTKKNNLEKLKYQDIPQWDSIGHMSLISEIESAFKISLKTDDVIDFSSYKKGIEILKKYKVKF